MILSYKNVDAFDDDTVDDYAVVKQIVRSSISIGLTWLRSNI